ncbi:hypothetical protein [Sinomonas sp. P10A9]|uniref:Uncharacterized protein n=1 Tax=Sinomonas puerhi TaxID=3238584 RepID=A0AB39KZ90_9MICC
MSTTTFAVGLRVTSRSFGPGVVKSSPAAGAALVEFDGGQTVMLRAADLRLHVTAAEVHEGGRFYYVRDVVEFAVENGLDVLEVFAAVVEVLEAERPAVRGQRDLGVLDAHLGEAFPAADAVGQD